MILIGGNKIDVVISKILSGQFNLIKFATYSCKSVAWTQRKFFFHKIKLGKTEFLFIVYNINIVISLLDKLDIEFY